VGFPDNILTDDEQVELHLHPHWIRLVTPVVVGVLALGLTLFGVLAIPAGRAQQAGQWLVLIAGVLVVIVFTIRPWLRWLTTSYVITTERVIIRQGILSRTGRDIPLQRLNDVSFSHSLWERFLGSGTLVIESAGERGQVILDDVPRVENVHAVLYRLADADDQRRRGVEDDDPSPHAR
jgi:uncharacterized membrane protein YdbT with pleckstrin-like domain